MPSIWAFFVFMNIYYYHKLDKSLSRKDGEYYVYYFRYGIIRNTYYLKEMNGYNEK